MKIKTIVFDGGLGNQLFQFALYLAIRKRYPESFFLWDISQSECQHSGFELFRLFSVKGSYCVKIYRWMEKHMKGFMSSFCSFNDRCPYLFDDEVFLDHGGKVTYKGFWQSYKYFLDIEDEVREQLTFDTSMLNSKTRSLSDILCNDSEHCYTSLHVRRGDYLKFSSTRIDYAYYPKAITEMRRKYPETRFVVFSDDQEWVKENISVPDAIYVDWNTGKDSWQDMYLMSVCHNNIIANSTFSWWGAWLNRCPDKTVVAPDFWIKDYCAKLDITPDNWLLVDSKCK